MSRSARICYSQSEKRGNAPPAARKAAGEPKATGALSDSLVSPRTPSDSEEGRVVEKVYRRLVWFLVLLFIVSYLDRVNVNFAALTMNKDLKLSATAFSLAGSLFYVTYVLAEIPSNLLMARVGARLWIPRIMITWGIASAATLFATDPLSLYVFRALTGLAEAGFMPGVLLYLTYWFPSSHRARATSLFIMAQPITIAFGSILSGLILQMDGFLGLAGWRWLFLIEGVPAVILGVIAYFYLDDAPETARWLTEREKVALNAAVKQSEIKDERQRGEREGSLARELLSVPILLLSLAYLGLVVSLVSNSTWTPLIIRSLYPAANFLVIGLFGALPAGLAIAAMLYWGRSSDRRQERLYHVVIPMAVAVVGWSLVAFMAAPIWRLAGLALCSAGTFSAQGIFWTLPNAFLSPRSRPLGIALINTVGMFGTTVGPVAVGWLKDSTGSFAYGLAFVGASVAIGAVAILLMRSAVPRRRVLV